MLEPDVPFISRDEAALSVKSLAPVVGVSSWGAAGAWSRCRHDGTRLAVTVPYRASASINRAQDAVDLRGHRAGQRGRQLAAIRQR